jgi:MEMO1 family protein
VQSKSFKAGHGHQVEAEQDASRSKHMIIRRAAVVGSFYPADPDRLRRQILDLLAGSARAKTTPKAVIAPHAGYIYSGPVAAAAFAMLRGFDAAFARVVVIGPAHYVPIRGIAVPQVDAFETPLGRVPVDRKIFGDIADLPFVLQNDAAHAPEHALEVEIPFLQIILSSFSLVPLVVGDATAKNVAQVLAQLWGGPETLLVVSSDLSHYHSYETARRLDAATAAAIEKGEPAVLGPGQACGYLPIAGLLIEANPESATACHVQFRRHRRPARSGRWLWGLDVQLRFDRDLGEIDRKSFEIAQRAKRQRRLMGGAQHHARRLLGFKRFLPALSAKAPAIAAL